MPRLFAREQLGAHNRAARSTQLGNFSAKLFGKGASDQEIGKAPTIMEFASPRSSSSSISRLNMSRLMKLHYSPAQFDIQLVANDGYLNHVRMANLVRHRLIAPRHVTPL
jgi:hypothetical protein